MCLLYIVLLVVGFFFPPAWLVFAGIWIYRFASRKSRRAEAVEERVRRMILARQNHATFPDLYFEAARAYAIEKGGGTGGEADSASVTMVIERTPYFVVFGRISPGEPGTFVSITDRDRIRDDIERFANGQPEQLLAEIHEEISNVFGRNAAGHTTIRRETAALSARAAPITAIDGSVTVRTSQDWEALVARGRTAITGDLIIEAPTLPHRLGNARVSSIGGDLNVRSAVLTSLDLPELSKVGGHLYIAENDALTSLNLPALTELGGSLHVRSNALTSLSLPALSKVGGHLNVTKNDALTSIDLPALSAVRWYLSVEDNNALTSLTIPALTTVSENDAEEVSFEVLGIENNAVLTSIDLRELTNVGAHLHVMENGALTTLSLPALSAVKGGLDVSHNGALTSLHFPSLSKVGWQLDVHHNDALTSLSLPVLIEVGERVEVHDNAALPDCQVDHLRERFGHDMSAPAVAVEDV